MLPIRVRSAQGHLIVLAELSVSMVIAALKFTREDGLEIHCSYMGGTRIPEGICKITVTSGALVNFILVVQRDDVFEDFAVQQFHHEFDCVVITGGDGQPDIRTRAFFRKIKDCLPVLCMRSLIRIRRGF